MLMILAALLGGIGLLSVLSRSTLLGVLTGLQLMFMGAAMAFALAGIGTKAAPAAGVGLGSISGMSVALFVVLGAVAQLVGGYALATRLFYLKRTMSIRELRSLKR